MKNYLEQLNITVVSAVTDYTSSTTINASSDVKIQDNKLWDTSSSANAFSGLSAGDVIKMSGLDKSENNGIFIVAEVETSGEWVRFDRPILEELSPTGVTMYDTPDSLTVTNVAIGESEVVAALNMENFAGITAADFRVTGANTVSSFASVNGDSSGDSVAIFWADLSEG